MPLYEYKCPNCQVKFEQLQRMMDPAPPCPKCNFEPVTKQISQGTSFELKGTGYYATDFKNK